MRIIKNETYIKRRAQIGERAPLIGLGLLVAATVFFIWQPEWGLLTMVVIWLGFISSMVGTYLGERYVGPMAYHKRLPEALKGLTHAYTLLMYKGPASFMLLQPGGVTVFTIKPQGGEIAYHDSVWTHKDKMKLLRRFAGQDALGRPDRLAQAEAAEVRHFLSKKLPEVDIPVRSVLVFINPEAQLHVEDPPVITLRAAELKRWLRKEGDFDKKLSEAERARLEEVLGIQSEDET